MGPIGLNGVAGSTGLTGLNGTRGAAGSTGIAGKNGTDGPVGLAGLTGLNGAAGPTGATGLPGLSGAAGIAGPIGLTGAAGSAGPVGPAGANGSAGPTGLAGPVGPTGANGSAGPTGLAGPVGSAGSKGETGAAGGPGPIGPAGAAGATGPAGPQGPSGSPAYAEFYAVTPPDNAATVAAGTPVQFPHDGPTDGSIIRRNTAEFVLPSVGTYSVNFSVSVTEPGQLVIAMDSGGGMVELPYTVYGRATGTSLIAGATLLTTTVADSAVELRNPLGNTPALTVTPLAGGAQPAVASIVIQQLG